MANCKNCKGTAKSLNQPKVRKNVSKTLNLGTLPIIKDKEEDKPIIKSTEVTEKVLEAYKEIVKNIGPNPNIQYKSIGSLKFPSRS